MGGFGLLGGGLDVRGLVDQILFAESAPIRRVEEKQDKVNLKIQAYTDLVSKLTELGRQNRGSQRYREIRGQAGYFVELRRFHGRGRQQRSERNSPNYGFEAGVTRQFCLGCHLHDFKRRHRDREFRSGRWARRPPPSPSTQPTVR